MIVPDMAIYDAITIAMSVLAEHEGVTYSKTFDRYYGTTTRGKRLARAYNALEKYQREELK
jgi:hypothetical protein